MSGVRIRPRFDLTSPLSGEEVLDRLRAHCRRDPSCTGTILNGYAILGIPEADRHYWTPRLTIELASDDDGATRIIGLFAPRPAVWTLFAAFYGFAMFLGFVGFSWGFSQWTLDMPATAMWLVPLSILLLLGAYGIALTGQRLGAEQMTRLRGYLETALNRHPD